MPSEALTALKLAKETLEDTTAFKQVRRYCRAQIPAARSLPVPSPRRDAGSFRILRKRIIGYSHLSATDHPVLSRKSRCTNLSCLSEKTDIRKPFASRIFCEPIA